MFKAGDKVVYRDRYSYLAPRRTTKLHVMTVIADVSRQPSWNDIRLYTPEGCEFISHVGYLKKYKTPALKFGVAIEFSTRSVDKATKLAEQLAKDTGCAVKVIHV